MFLVYFFLGKYKIVEKLFFDYLNLNILFGEMLFLIYFVF